MTSTQSLRRRTFGILIVLLLCCVGLALAKEHKSKSANGAGTTPGVPELLEESVGVKDISPRDCAEFIDGVPATKTVGSAGVVVGSAGTDHDFWSAGHVTTPNVATVFAYRVAFSKPVSFGTVVIIGGAQKIGLLKSDAPFPGDVSKPEQWTMVDVPKRQSIRSLAPVPPDTSVRAIAIFDTRLNGESKIHSVRFLERRIFNATPLGQAYGDAEFTLYPFLGSPITYHASSLISGWGYWQDHGPTKENRITTPQVTDINPAWLILGWEDRRSISGIWIKSNLVEFNIDVYVGPDSVNPRAGTDAEWKHVKPLGVFQDGDAKVVIINPVSTRGLRFRITQTSEPTIAAQVHAVHTLTDLGDKPVPVTPESAAEPSPVQVHYTTDIDSEVTVAIDNQDGVRVRNLIARDWRNKGDQVESWDLKDEKGSLVPPGKYTWKVLYHPALDLKYEMTAYPNVQDFFPDRAPWPTGSSGTGGWATNHTPPTSVAAVGDNIYVGSYVSEGGAALLEADLSGKKSWGMGNFAAWTGPQFLAADGEKVYVQARVLQTDTDNVYAVDRKFKSVSEALSLRPTGTRNRRVVGLAALNGKVYLSSDAQSEWLNNAVQPSDVDFLAGFPKLVEKRKEKFPHEMVPDPRGDTLRLFRLTGTIPGQANVNGSLDQLESTKGSGHRQYLVLAFNRPVPLGSVVFPVPKDAKYEVRLSVLKPDAPYPPNPGDPRQWTPFETQAKQAWDVASPAQGTVTRAIRVAFIQGGDDMFTDTDESANFSAVVDDKAMPGDEKKGQVMASDSDNWFGAIEGMKLLRRRYANVAPAATIRVSSGSIAKDGVWDAKRTDPISLQKPGVYQMEWKDAQALRGLAFKEVDGKQIMIDAYTGPASAPLTLDGMDGWETISEFQPVRRVIHSGGGNYTEALARYVDSYVDFGREVTTRAIRIRVVEQWTETGGNPQFGVRMDRGLMTLDPTRCHIYGVAALKYLGGEAAEDPMINERIESFNVATQKLDKEVYVKKPGNIAIDPKGQVFAVSESKVVKVDMDKGATQDLITDLEKPQSMAVDSESNIYVFDSAKERQNIRVYDSTGKLVRTIGEPGGREAGPWNPLRMKNVTAMAVDRLGQVWATEGNMWPKRVVQWGPDGALMKEILGPTQYGGGGCLDPWDKKRLFFESLEFEQDWSTGKTKLKSWMADGGVAADQPIHIGDRLYIVSRPQGSEANQQCGVVYLYENGKMRPVAAMGTSEAFPLLKSPAVRQAIGWPILKCTRFVWSDLNGDGQVQPDEIKVELMPGDRPMTWVGNFNDDLSTQSATLRYQVTRILPNGTPVYERKEYPLDAAGYKAAWGVYRTDDGNFFSMGGGGQPEASLSPEGKIRWTYPSEGTGVHALYSAGPWTPHQVVSEFAVIGHETAPVGDLGEFLVTSSNVGTWNIWTTDGMLAGQIFRDMRDPRRQAWSMDECNRGLMMSDTTVGQEHFQGYFCRTREDNKYYVVGGGLSTSVVEVIGLDKFKRLKGELDITPKLQQEAEAWDRARQKREVYQRSPVVDCFKLKGPPAFDNELGDWGFTSAEMDNAKLSVGYTDKELCLRYEVTGLGPMKNTGDQWDKLFKTGASVDLQMGVDPAAPDDRKSSVAGDLRLLMTWMGDKPTAVLYQPVVPGTSPDKVWRVLSPVGQAEFDKVSQVQGVRMAMKDLSEETGSPGYIVEACIPLELIGLKPGPDVRLRFDWGVLVSGKDGHEVLRRIYWSNKATAIVSDAPSEAQMYPNLWGHIRFLGAAGKANSSPDASMPGKTHDKAMDEFMDDMENEKK